MSLKNFMCKIYALRENKYATFLLLLASFFVMLSAKVTPIVYAPLEWGMHNPFFDIYEIFPLSFFAFCICRSILDGRRTFKGEIL